MACAKHPGEAARCATCGSEFCPACEGVTGPCRACAYRGTAAAADERAREHDRAAAAHLGPDFAARRRRRLVVEGVAVAALVGVLVATRPVFSGPAHGSIGGPATGSAGYAACVENVWALREAIAEDLWTKKRPPEALPPERRCPAEGKAYEYAAAPDGAFFLACPSPAAHGVRAIEAGPRSRAPVVTP